MSRIVASCWVVAGLTLLGCGDSKSAGSIASTDFESISMEQGGACVGSGPCWWRTAVAAPGKLTLANPMLERTADIKPAELEEVEEITGRKQFRGTIEDPKDVCAVAFDSEFIFVLETSSGTFTDKQASGCVLNTEEYPQHDYRDLFQALDKLRRAYFPGVLPF